MTDQDTKPKTKAKPKMVEIENVMKAGKLFTSQGVCKPGERIKVPAKEAKHFCADQLVHSTKGKDSQEPVTIKRPPKARIPFPDDALSE